MALKKYSFPVILLVVAVALWSCGKTDDVLGTAAKTAQLNVINAVTDVRAIDFYLNGTRQNNNSAIYLFNSSGYSTVLASEQQYQFKRDTGRTVLTDIKLNPAKADSSYTLILTGQQSLKNVTPIFIADYFPVLVDSVTSASNAKMRFVQASPGAALYDVFITDTLSTTKTVYDTVSFKNSAFKTVKPFRLVKPGTKIIKITLAGTSTVLYKAITTLQSNSYYTLYTGGVTGGSGLNAFGAAINLTR